VLVLAVGARPRPCPRAGRDPDVTTSPEGIFLGLRPRGFLTSMGGNCRRSEPILAVAEHRWLIQAAQPGLPAAKGGVT
jgi:hypothetical protein